MSHLHDCNLPGQIAGSCVPAQYLLHRDELWQVPVSRPEDAVEPVCPEGPPLRPGGLLAEEVDLPLGTLAQEAVPLVAIDGEGVQEGHRGRLHGCRQGDA